jgi:hypothetical protein
MRGDEVTPQPREDLDDISESRMIGGRRGGTSTSICASEELEAAKGGKRSSGWCLLDVHVKG